MRYLALVTDYDGTLAMGGKVDETTLSALERLRMSGRRAILLTGRQLDDLLSVCPRLSAFDYAESQSQPVGNTARRQAAVLRASLPKPAGDADSTRPPALDRARRGAPHAATRLGPGR